MGTPLGADAEFTHQQVPASTEPRRTVRARIAAKLGALACGSLLLAWLFLAISAQTAFAGLYNPIPANAQEDPSFEFTDNEALFAYFTSDVKGGTICVVSGAVTNPDEASCDQPAWGTPNFELTIGLGFSLLEKPPLPPGEWKLLVEDTQKTGHALSPAFLVTPCPGCSHEIGEEAVERFKNAAATTGIGAVVACTGLTVKEILKDHAGVTERIEEATKKAQDFGVHDPPSVTGDIVSLGGGLFGFAFSPPSEHIGEEKALEILKEITCGLSLMYVDIVKDPSDPNFTAVAEPEFSTFPPLESAAGESAVRAIDRVRGLGVATLTSYERYLGAKEANEEPYVHSQANAVATQGRTFIDEMRTAAGALRNFAAELDTLPEFQQPIVSTEGKEKLVKAYERIAKDGFSAEETKQLRELGLSESEISELRTHFSIDMSRLPANATVGAVLREMAKGMEDEIAEYDAFVREAAAVAARVNPALTAPVITAQPQSVTVTTGEAASFEAAASGEPCTQSAVGSFD